MFLPISYICMYNVPQSKRSVKHNANINKKGAVIMKLTKEELNAIANLAKKDTLPADEEINIATEELVDGVLKIIVNFMNRYQEHINE